VLLTIFKALAYAKKKSSSANYFKKSVSAKKELILFCKQDLKELQ
jgi:hypothetical protein